MNDRGFKSNAPQPRPIRAKAACRTLLIASITAALSFGAVAAGQPATSQAAEGQAASSQATEGQATASGAPVDPAATTNVDASALTTSTANSTAAPHPHAEVLLDTLESTNGPANAASTANAASADDATLAPDAPTASGALAGTSLSLPTLELALALSIGRLESYVQWPLATKDEHVTDGFGPRVSPCAGCSSNHRGVDFAGAEGTPIGAVAAGTVVETDTYGAGGLGVHVVVEHVIEGTTYRSVYGHMQHGSLTVAVGDEIAAGERLGSLGNTGASTGPHLHLEILRDGTHVDPLSFLYRFADGRDEVEITDRPSLPWDGVVPAPSGDGDGSGADDATVPDAVGADPADVTHAPGEPGDAPIADDGGDGEEGLPGDFAFGGAGDQSGSGSDSEPSDEGSEDASSAADSTDSADAVAEPADSGFGSGDAAAAAAASADATEPDAVGFSAGTPSE